MPVGCCFQKEKALPMKSKPAAIGFQKEQVQSKSFSKMPKHIFKPRTESPLKF